MKRLTLISIVILFAFASLKGQMKSREDVSNVAEETNVSDLAVNNFSTDFGEVSEVQWNRSSKYDKATFTKEGNTTTAFYDESGDLVGTTTTLSSEDLPEKGLEQIKRKYGSYSIESVMFYHNPALRNPDSRLLGTNFTGSDNYFAVLEKGADRIVLQVNTDGQVHFYTKI